MPIKVKDTATLSKNVASLHHKLDAMAERLERVERRLGMFQEPSAKETPNVKSVSAPVAKVHTEPPAPALPHVDNLGYKLFGAVGFLFIILGLYYLYSWTVDQGILSPVGRLAIGVLAGIGLVTLAEGFVRTRYGRFADVLAGGGVALLYFTVYASYHFTAFREATGMGLALNSVLLLVVAGSGVWLALRADSKVLAAFSTLLAYTTSFLPGGHQSLLAALVTSAALWFVLLKKGWHYTYVPVIAAYLVFFVQSFGLERYGIHPLAFLAYVGVLFALFTILGLAYDARDDTIAVAVAFKNGIFAFLVSLAVVSRAYPDYSGVFTFVFALLHLLLWLVADAKGLRRVADAFLVLAAGLSIIAIPVQLERAWITILWAVEGTLLVLLGMKYERLGLRLAGYAALVLASLRALTIESWTLAGGERTVTFAMVIAALLVVTWMLHRRSDLLKLGMTAPYIASFTTAFVVTVFLAIDILSGNGIAGAFPIVSRSAFLSVAWAAVGIVAYGWGSRQGYDAVRFSGLAVLGIVATKTLLVDAAIDAGPRTLAYCIAVIVFAVATFLARQRQNGSELSTETFLLALTTMSLVTVTVAVEILDYQGFLAALDVTVRQVILSSVWAVLAIALVAGGFVYGSRGVRVFGLILFGVTIAKVLLFDLGGVADVYRVLVTILVGVLALGGSFAYVRNRERLEKLART